MTLPNKDLLLMVFLLCVILIPCLAMAGDETGLREEIVDCLAPGEAILRCDWENSQPESALVRRDEMDGREWFTKSGEKAAVPESFWLLRHPGWTPALLNAVGKPPDITYDPKLTSPCDIYLGIRAVTPMMTFGIRLSSEEEFTVITAPAATETYHYDLEFHWKVRVPMAGEKIILRALGKPVYLEYFRFVPYVTRKETKLAPTEHIVICQEKGRHFAFPGVAELPNGDLAVVCREGVGHVCPFGRIVLIRSRDGGRTWDPRVCINDTPSDERDPAIIVLPDGTVAVSFNTWHSWMSVPSLKKQYAEQTAVIEKAGGEAFTGNKLIFSKDNGHTWSEPVSTPTFSPHGPVVGEDGNLYYVGLEVKYEKLFNVIYRSTDGGKTWQFYSEVAYSRHYAPGPCTWEAFDEPNLCILPGNRWVTTIRVDVDGLVRQSHSGDGGHNWTFPTKLAVKGFPQQLCRLKDGRLLMAYGYRFEPMGIRACLSADAGKTWDLSREIVLRSEGGHGDLGYPYSIQLKDGRVFTVYYYNHKGGDCYIEGAFYRP